MSRKVKELAKRIVESSEPLELNRPEDKKHTVFLCHSIAATFCEIHGVKPSVPFSFPIQDMSIPWSLVSYLGYLKPEAVLLDVTYLPEAQRTINNASVDIRFGALRVNVIDQAMGLIWDDPHAEVERIEHTLGILAYHGLKVDLYLKD